MSQPKNINIFSWRNKEGFRAVLNCYNGFFKLCIFAPKKNNSGPSGPIEYFIISDTDFFSKIRHECEQLWKADNGTTATCVAFKIDQASRQKQHAFVISISKENNPDYLYAISFNFAGTSKKDYSFAFESNNLIVISSRPENKVQDSANKFKDFITVLGPDKIIDYHSHSIGDKNGSTNTDAGKSSFTSTVRVEDDIPI